MPIFPLPNRAKFWKSVAGCGLNRCGQHPSEDTGPQLTKKSSGNMWELGISAMLMLMLSTKSMGFGKRHLPQSQLFDQTSSFFNLQIHDLHWLSTTHSKKMYRTGLPHFLMMFGQHTTRLPNPQPLIFVKRTELLRRSLPRLKSVQRRLPRTWQKVADCNRWVKVLGNPIPMSHCCGSFQKMVVFKGKWMIYHQIFEIPYFQTDAQLTFTHEICKTKPMVITKFVF